MKNLVVLFVAIFSFVLVSCSDVLDNSLPTSPILEKSITHDGTIVPNGFPYSYLFSFSEVKGIKFSTSTESETILECYMSDNQSKYTQLFVVVNFNNYSIAPKMFFINKIDKAFFKVNGININQVNNISVYGLSLDNISTYTESPFTNNTEMSELGVANWKSDGTDIHVEAAGIWPSNLKYVFAELTTKQGKVLVFLQRPTSGDFIIPQYGKYGVNNLRLLGYHTVVEKELSQF
jgi:hypothetical protein